ncbi:MAG: tetratricopeptide repeat-containing sensor histidine kinase [Bacteroidota bacterium]
MKYCPFRCATLKYWLAYLVALLVPIFGASQSFSGWEENYQLLGQDSLLDLRKIAYEKHIIGQQPADLANWGKTVAVDLVKFGGDYQHAAEINQEAIKYAQQAGDKGLEAKCWNNQGIFLMWLRKYEAAYQAYENCLMRENQDQPSPKTLHNMGNLKILSGKLQQAIPLFQHAARLNKDQPGSLVKNHLGIGTAYAKLRKWDSAKVYLLKTYRLAEQLSIANSYADLNLQLGYVYNESYHADSAYYFFSNCMKIAQSTQNHEDLALAHHGFGNWHLNQREYAEAITQLEKAVEVMDGNLYDFTSMVYGALAMTHKRMGHISISRDYYEKGIEMAQALEKKGELVDFRLSLANLERELKNYSAAEGLLKANLSDSLVIADVYSFTKNKIELGIVLYNSGNSIEAERLMLEAIGPAEQIGEWEDLASAHTTVAAISMDKDDSKAVWENMQLAQRWRDSVQAGLYSEGLARVRTQFETDLKEQEISQLNQNQELLEDNLAKTKRERNLLVLLAIILLVFVAVVGYLLNRIRQQQKRITDQRDRLEQLNHSKDRLFALIAHDLAGPISGFNDLNRLFQHNIRQEKWDRLTELSGHVAHQSKQLRFLLDNLLQWALQQMNAYRAETLEFNLIATSQEQLEVFHTQAEQKGIKVNLVPNEENVPLLGDQKGFRIALGNLLANAIKFSEGGEIILQIQKMDGGVEVLVKDNGTGMSPEKIEELQSDSLPHPVSGSRGERGTGLGLQFVKTYVDQSKGEFIIHSTLGKGSQIGFFLPDNAHKS